VYSAPERGWEAFPPDMRLWKEAEKESIKSGISSLCFADLFLK
jgi:hypothetical protein